MAPQNQSNSSESVDPLPPDMQAGFGLVAKRWSSWAANLLVTAVILIAGLSFGRHVLTGWRTEAARPVEVAAQYAQPLQSTHDDQLHRIQFGQREATLERKTFHGEPRAVLKELRRQCQGIVESTSSADLLATSSSWLPPGALKPVASRPGEWELYEQQIPLPMVIGVKKHTQSESASGSDQVAGPRRRVVCWSIALPSAISGSENSAGGQWVLFTISPTGGPPWSNDGETAFPLPPGCERSLLIGSPDRMTLIGFEGDVDEILVMEFFDHIAEGRGWCQHPVPQEDRKSRSRVYTSGDGKLIHIACSRKQDHPLRGLVLVAPPLQNPRGAENQ